MVNVTISLPQELVDDAKLFAKTKVGATFSGLIRLSIERTLSDAKRVEKWNKE
ncbi:hypothetical protein HYY74_04525 [Candidatus Woesearchaeota archaeon]|nr:hypothetical protein [Candidatus Woesearchaeota archaeon]